MNNTTQVIDRKQTISGWMFAYLFERGMFEDDAKQVVENVMNDEANEAMQGRWNDEIHGYPEVIKRMMALSLRNATIDWIDANCPKAWYRPMFEA